MSVTLLALRAGCGMHGHGALRVSHGHGAVRIPGHPAVISKSSHLKKWSQATLVNVIWHRPSDFELAPFRQQMLTAVPELADLERWEQQAPETWQWIVGSPHISDFHIELQQIGPGLIVALVDEAYSWEPREMPDPDAAGVLTALARGRVPVLQIKHGPFDWSTFTWVLTDLDGAQHSYPDVPAHLTAVAESAAVLTDSRPPQQGGPHD